ncbi:MAG: aldo/keto reductase [Candidatus Promineifilaceae bacterium]|nr:aldo/keto reductase [Candidatus Promineifilaceae bacterium]
MKTVQANGASIPALGFGTFRLKGDEAEAATRMALEVGYRHIDTAQAYENEEAIARAIRASGVPREEIFITTKIWPDHFDEEEFPVAVNARLQALETDYVDLLLLHWPNPSVPLEDTIGALNVMREVGKTRHIGVANFTTGLLDEALSLTAAPLVTNQVEYHPFLDQSTLLTEVHDYGMSLTAYSPLAKGQVAEDETLQEIGAAHGKSAAQVALRWLLQQEGVVAIPKASSREHIEQNFAIWGFELDDDEMARIFSLTERNDRLVNPARLAPDWGTPRAEEPATDNPMV